MIKNFRKGIALSPRPSKFGPLLFAGDLEKGMQFASEYDFDVVELSLRSVDDVQPDDLKNRLDELNLRVSAIATGQACLFDNLCMGTEDDEIRAKTVAHFKDIVSLAKEIQSEAVIIGGIRGRMPENFEGGGKYYQKGIDAFRECAQWADQNGITLLIEAINRYETNWIHTADDGLEVLELMGVATAKLLLDTFHMNIEEANIPQALKKTGERLGYVHFADNTRVPPGQGQTDFRKILETLTEIDYNGPIVVEALPQPDDETAVKNTAEFWKKMTNS